MDDDLLTTGDVARYCQVSPVTVFRWVKNGKLKAYTTPGGHYRIRKGDFHVFLKESGMPIREFFFDYGARRVLVVSSEPQIAGFIVGSLREDRRLYEVATATDTIEAGLQLAMFKPELIILDATLVGPRVPDVCGIMKNMSPVQPLKILLIAATNQAEAAALESCADDCLCPPVGHPGLRSKVEHLLNGHG
jgi:two-component system response regulator VicR